MQKNTNPRMRLITAVLILLAVISQSACFFRGEKRALLPTGPVQIAFLPFNTPEGNADLRWISMAVPVMLASISRESEVLEPVPLWETMRFTLESTRNSRTINAGNAAYVANWLNVKWSIMGMVSGENSENIELLIDFIPPQDTSIPYRYIKKIRMENFDKNVRKSFDQFLNYIAAPELEDSKAKHLTLPSLRQLAEAVDREYGWTVEAQPGNSEEIVANLVQSDVRLARYLFNPNLYPILEENR